MMKPNLCWHCGEDVAGERWALGYRLCLSCGEEVAREVKHCVVPMHKSNYVLATSVEFLVGVNNKGGIVK